MGEKTESISLKMAKASEKEVQDLLDWFHKIEASDKCLALMPEFHSEHISGLEKLELPDYMRTVFGYQVLVDNTCKKDSKILEFNDELVQLDKERDALREWKMKALRALAFAESCIKSGEDWTETCEREIGDLLRDSAPPQEASTATKSEGDGNG